jgi:hypothetical protein
MGSLGDESDCGHVGKPSDRARGAHSLAFAGGLQVV